jgi:hypothetical protein
MENFDGMLLGYLKDLKSEMKLVQDVQLLISYIQSKI